MRLQVNYQLISFLVWTQSIFIEQNCYKRSQAIALTVLSFFFDVKQERPETDHKCYQYSASIVIPLDFKDSLVT